jgi:hypothetical protein
MMTCVIGLELNDGRVRWVCYDTDGRLEKIVPILRTYKTHDDVKKLLDLGFQSGVPMTADRLPATVDRAEVDNPSEIADDRYELAERCCQYIFTESSTWMCRSPDFFVMPS